MVKKHECVKMQTFHSGGMLVFNVATKLKSYKVGVGEREVGEGRDGEVRYVRGSK